MTQTPLPHIVVCICTFRRPMLLARLLESLAVQHTEARFSIALVVVDNDRMESARVAVETFAARSGVPVRYFVEPEQNIALARNRAVAAADGDWLAMLDDDEFVEPTWLLNLHRTLLDCRADGVLAPVRPFFEVPAPAWVVKGRFCERAGHTTGTRLREARQTRTGNVLLRRALFVGDASPFDARLGRTGGEDVDFFRRQLERGRCFVWCDEAPAFESVPAERLTRRYFLRRALLRGVANSQRVSLVSKSMLKSLAASTAYSLVLPLLLLWRHEVFMQCLMRNCDHLGKIFAVCGVRLVRQRTEG